MTETITIRTDDETEHALDILTGEGISRSAAIRQAVIQAAERRERGAELRRAVLAMDLGEPDGVDVAAELARDRGTSADDYLDTADIVRVVHAQPESPVLRAWLDERAEAGWVRVKGYGTGRMSSGPV